MEKGAEWLSFDPKTGLLKGNVTSNDFGKHNIKIKATDTKGASVTASGKSTPGDSI